MRHAHGRVRAALAVQLVPRGQLGEEQRHDAAAARHPDEERAVVVRVQLAGLARVGVAAAQPGRHVVLPPRVLDGQVLGRGVADDVRVVRERHDVRERLLAEQHEVLPRRPALPCRGRTRRSSTRSRARREAAPARGAPSGWASAASGAAATRCAAAAGEGGTKRCTRKDHCDPRLRKFAADSDFLETTKSRPFLSDRAP